MSMSMSMTMFVSMGRDLALVNRHAYNLRPVNESESHTERRSHTR